MWLLCHSWNFSEGVGCSRSSLPLKWCRASCWYETSAVILNQRLVCRNSCSTSSAERREDLKPPAVQVFRLLGTMKMLVSLVLGLLLSPQLGHCSRNDQERCKPVTASFCHGLGYSSTLHPTGVSGYNLQQIGQMVETACSPLVATLMCRVVVPECSSEDNSRTKPCRALCEKVKADCEPVFRTKRLYWPMRLRCDALPASNCVEVGVKW